MPFSFRPDPELDALLRRIAADRGWSKAQVVREAVAEYGRAKTKPSKKSDAPTALDRLRPYIGVVSTGGAQLSLNTHAKYQARLRRKTRARRSR